MEVITLREPDRLAIAKLTRREKDIVNLRKKLDKVLDELDKVKIELEDERIKNMGKHNYRDKYCYVPAIPPYKPTKLNKLKLSNL